MKRRRFIQMMTTGGAILTLPAHEILAFAQLPAAAGSNPHFPVLICDDNDEIWAATEVRDDLPGKIHIDNVVDGKLVHKCVIEVPGATGIAPPALAAWGGGCVVCFAVEKQDTWLIAYAFVDNSTSGIISPQIIQSEGSANISPVVAVSGGKAHILWESNARGFRGICHCSADPTSASQPIRLSSAAANSYNPAICAMENGVLFAAWDSYRSQSSDIYMARHVNGSWQEEKRFTSDPRIERHPRLASRNGEIWMTWQAQAFTSARVNHFSENHVVVARVDGVSLSSPLSLFTEVSTNERNLLRPNIAFDSAGRLWLSAALGGEKGQSKWHAVVFCYNGARWTPLHKLHEESRGQWHPTPMAFSGRDGAQSAVQFDDRPEAWVQMGIYPDWNSWVELQPLPEINLPAVPFLTESLRMPSTDFSIKKIIQQQNLEMERQKWEHNGKVLGLYWGTLHNHSDISVCVRQNNPPGHDLYANERDIEGADFCSINDHGYNFDKQQWQLNGEQTRNNHDPGRFVTFLGEEWTSDCWPKGAPKEERGYGHRNIIFLDPYFGEYFDAYDADIKPSEIWERLRRDKVRCMFIPHQLADMGTNVPVDWDQADETYQPLAEIYQTRGSYEYLGCPRQARRSATFKGNYLQDAWARGIVVGVVASPDHGGGDGKVGVWAPELSRAGIFDALAARHTFGTSGPKMAIQFSSGRFMMGDKAPLEPGPISFKIKAVAGTAIRQVVIFRNNVKVFEQTPGTASLDINWKDTSPPEVKRLWYYARIETDDTHLAWSSPIWFIQS